MDIKEYNLIVDKYSDDLFRFALRYTGDEDESNDAVQVLSPYGNTTGKWGQTAPKAI